MQKWKIIQILIKLPPYKLVTALLLFFIFTSLSINTAVVIYFKGEINEVRREKNSDKKYFQNLDKRKDSIHEASQNRHLDFVEEQLKEGFKYKIEIDSLKQQKNVKR